MSLAEKFGLSFGLAFHTCPKCGAHTAGKPPVSCWACEPKLVRVDAVTWHRCTLADGSLGWTGKCPCGRTVHSGYSRPLPSARHCPCGQWLRSFRWISFMRTMIWRW